MRYMLLVLAVVAMLVGGAAVSSGTLHMHSYKFLCTSGDLYEGDGNSHTGTVSYTLFAQAYIYGGNWCWAESLIYDDSWTCIDYASADSAGPIYTDTASSTSYFYGDIHTYVHVKAQSNFCSCTAEASVWW